MKEVHDKAPAGTKRKKSRMERERAVKGSMDPRSVSMGPTILSTELKEDGSARRALSTQPRIWAGEGSWGRRAQSEPGPVGPN
eukprot:4523129-Heterocapsa_arctica.AAC.1